MAAVRAERSITMAIQRHFAKLKKDGHEIFWFKVQGGPTQMSGIPDLCVVYYGVAVFFEVKTVFGKLTTLQARRIDEIKAAGGIAEVVRSVEDVANVLRSVENFLPVNDVTQPAAPGVAQ